MRLRTWKVSQNIPKIFCIEKTYELEGSKSSLLEKMSKMSA